MGFLAKLAQGILKGIQIVTGLAPTLEAQLPQFGGRIQQVEGELEQLAGVIMQVEVFGQALQIPGPQKLIAAAPAFEQIVLRSSFMANKKVGDEAKFKKAIEGLASSYADLMNALHDDAVKTIDKSS